MIILLKFFDNIIGLVNIALSYFVKNNNVTIEKKISSICLIKLSAMGDVICLASAVQQYKSLYPDVAFTLLTSKRSNPDFIKEIKCFNAVYSIRMSPLVLKDLLMFKRNFDFDIVVDCDQYYHVSEFISFLYKNTVGFSTQRKGKLFSFVFDYDHQLLEKQNFLSLLKIIEKKFVGKENLKNEFKDIIYCNELYNNKFFGNVKGVIIVIYPGSSGTAKFRRWETENFVQLAIKLKNSFNVVIAGGLDEINLIPLFRPYFDDNLLLINKLELKEWVGFFANKKVVFVGNDAGLTHVADSCGVPCVSFFGPNTPKKWGATSKGSVSIYKNLSCSPCIQNGMGKIPSRCKYGHVNCLRTITVEEAIDVVQEVLIKSFSRKIVAENLL